ncbi:DUF563 domain-containing protein [Sulfitobacter albidus]|uniref:DUF563 domain-containing protein n=1 Tax=Sulfitobacter albidus TaxID=2829501 RepID=A0A975PM98_9RHOB|nr:glycosyltransferase 61 family protein [Sulfitobacter albidus]QUJ76010.1 DUF563 domain-containing protein [Sulfitobacter albidus]
MNSVPEILHPDTPQSLEIAPQIKEVEHALAAADWPHALERLMTLAKAQVVLKAHEAGVFLEDIDPLCARMAEGIDPDHPLPEDPIGFDRATNLYLVTEIYHAGGHRKLVEQIIAARPKERHVVLFTGMLENSRGFGMEAIVEAGGFPIYPDPALDHFDRLLWLREKLACFAAQRLFVLHHPEDVIAAVALAGVKDKFGPRAYVVHHADTVASVGVDLPEATHLAIRAEQKQQIAALRPQMAVHMLPLVYAPNLVRPKIPAEILERIAAEDHDFMQTGMLTTATCGGMHKFHGTGELSLPKVLARILLTTRGRHVHIGAISDAMRDEIYQVIDQTGDDRERLELVGEVTSVAQTLVERDVDLFLTSFPSGGGLTVVEAAYAGMPIAVYGGAGDDVGRYIAGLTHAPDDVLVWENVPELEESLRGFWQKGGRKRLREMSASARKWFNRGHSWKRYQGRLNALVRAVEEPRRTALDMSRRRVAETFVDRAYYERKNPDVVEAGLNPVDHFVSHGERRLRPVNPLFDAKYYLQQLDPSARAAAENNPLTHYVMRGEACGYKPHPLFDPAYCRAQLENAGLWSPLTGDPVEDSVLRRYVELDARVAPHMFFDPDHYLRATDDLPTGESALANFLRVGAVSGLSPHPLIDPTFLERTHGSFAKAFPGYLTQTVPSASEPRPNILFSPSGFAQDRLNHYAKAAPNLLWAHLIEGNLGECDPHTLINVRHIEKQRPGTLVSARAALYDLALNRLLVDTHPLVQRTHLLRQAPYAETLKISLTQYFMENSVSHNLDPHPLFSTQYYLYNNPDLKALTISPLEHFIQNGESEGRMPHPAFDSAGYYHRYLRGTDSSSSLLDYLSHKAGQFLPSPHLESGQAHLAGKMAVGLFEVGSDRAAADMLSASIHPDTIAAHPTLTSGTRTLCITDAEACEVQEVHPAEQVLVNRPSVVSQAHIAPPIGTYTAPAATAAVYRDASLMPGNDGFVARSGVWVDHGLDGFDPQTMQIKKHGAVAAVSGGKVLLRGFDGGGTVPSGILATGTYSGNYFNFLLEVLPRVLLAAEIAPEGTPILADAGLPEQHYQALRLYLPRNPVLRFARHTAVRVGRLYVGSMPNVIHDALNQDLPPVGTARFHPAIIERLSRPGSSQDHTASGGRLFLERNGLMRNMHNAPEISAALKERGFDSVTCERMTFSDQVSVFSQAGGGIVGQGGAHFANMLFSPKGTRVFALFSNAPGTDLYVLSTLGAMLGHDVVNVVGWRIVGTAPPPAAPVEEAFTVPVSLVTPFFPHPAAAPETGSALDDARALLDGLADAFWDANTLTSAWNLHSRQTPSTFDAAMLFNRRELEKHLRDMSEADVEKLLGHAFFQHCDRNICSGYVSLEYYSEQELQVLAQTQARFADLADPTGSGVDPRPNQLLALAILYIPVWKLPLVDKLDVFEEAIQQDLYLKWLATPPYLSRKGEDPGYVAYTERLLKWLARHCEEDVGTDIRARIMAATQRVDMGWLLLVDAPLRPTLEARNDLLEHIADRSGPAPVHSRAPRTCQRGVSVLACCAAPLQKGPTARQSSHSFGHSMPRDTKSLPTRWRSGTGLSPMTRSSTRNSTPSFPIGAPCQAAPVTSAKRSSRTILMCSSTRMPQPLVCTIWNARFTTGLPRSRCR